MNRAVSRIYGSVIRAASATRSKATITGILGLMIIPGMADAAWPNFNIYGFPGRWGSKSEAYFVNNGYFGKTKLLSQNSITMTGDATRMDAAKVKNYVAKFYPGVSDTGYLVLDWEAGPFHDLKTCAKGTTCFNVARDKLNLLIKTVKDLRPNVKVTIYGIPYRGYTTTQISSSNPAGKYTEVLRNVDFISPSLYILKADEATGHARNIQYLSENLNVALAYKAALGKPVIPHVWQRIHDRTGDEYSHQIIQKEVYAKYIAHMYKYSYNGLRSDGVVWWDEANSAVRMTDLGGINNHLGNTITDAASYDSHMVAMTAAIKSAIDNTSSASLQAVSSFTLVDALSGNDLQTISNGATINLASFPTKEFNIRANTAPSAVGSVKMALSGTESRTQLESGAPYALFGGNPYDSWFPGLGSYRLVGTPYTQSGGSGTAGTSLTIDFTVVNQVTTAQPTVTSFALVNADDGRYIKTITNGMVLYRSQIPARVNIRANTSSGVESVKMVLSGAVSKTQTESGVPYALFGGNPYNPWTPPLGSYILKGTAYSGDGASGTAGPTYSISFTVK